MRRDGLHDGEGNLTIDHFREVLAESGGGREREGERERERGSERRRQRQRDGWGRYQSRKDGTVGPGNFEASA